MFGAALAADGLALVTGGGRIGLMGVVADAVLDAGGDVTGVIPRFLVERELAHSGLTELHVVATLHERKTLMHELSDAFVALPGGFGTLDELAEAITWRQLGLHAKPIGLLDVDGYWSVLVVQLERGLPTGCCDPSTPICSSSSRTRVCSSTGCRCVAPGCGDRRSRGYDKEVRRRRW